MDAETPRRGPGAPHVTPTARALAALLALLPAAVAAQTVATPPAPFVDGVVLVGFVDQTTPAQHAAAVASVGATDLGVIGAGTHVLRVPDGSVSHVVAALRQRREVRYAEPDWIGHADGVPNDPQFASQWAFRNTGATFGGIQGVAGADEKAVPAWNVTTGSKTIVVGITDTGIEYTHSDLTGNVWSNAGGINGCAAGTHGYNVLTGTCDPMDDDTFYNGHGTHVSGIIGAVTNNGVGVAGVNWSTNLLAVKWLDSQANGTTSSLITALNWLVQAKQAGVNIRVVNDSATFVGTAFSQALSDEIDVLGANDILFVTAAGNTAQSDDDLATRRYPCGYMRPNELCVAATDNTDHLWSSSNFGVQTVNLAAPGYDIFSTLRGNTYGFISGCSMSAAQVSGAAALILSTGYQSATALRATILNGVDVLASLNRQVQTSGRLNLCNPLPGCVSAPTTTTTIQPPGGIVLRQSNAVEGTSVASLSSTFASGTTAGNLILAVVRMSTTTQSVTVTDSAHNTYTDAVMQAQTTDGHQVHLFYARGIAGGPDTVTATFSGTNTHPWLAIFEYSGLSTTNPLDQTAHAQGNSTAPSSGATGTTTAANELVFGAAALPASYAGTVTAGGGFTLQRQDAGTSRAATEARTVSAVGSYAGTFALGSSTNWSAVVATFVAAPNAGTTTTTTSTSTSTTKPSTTTTTSSTMTSSTTTTTSSSSTAPAPSTTTTTQPAGGGVALVQSDALEGTGVGSLSSTFASGNTAGNLILAVVRMSTTTQTVTVTDSAQNVYTDAVMQAQTTDGHQVHLFYARGIAGGPNTVTATFSGTNDHPWLAIYEYAGLRTTNPLDQTAHAQGSSAAPTSGATAATTAANELVFAALAVPASYAGTVTAGSGYTLQRQDVGTSRAATEAAAVGAVGSYAGTFALGSSTSWSAVVATFIAAPGGSTTTTTTSTTTTTPSSTTTTTSAPTTTVSSSSTVTTTSTSTSTTTTTTSTTVAAAPVNITPPVISGTPQQGQTLTTSNGTWSNQPTSYAYQWRRCKTRGMSCTAIAGAASPSYTLTSNDVGSFIRVAVTAFNSGGSNTAVSSSTAAVQ